MIDETMMAFKIKSLLSMHHDSAQGKRSGPSLYELVIVFMYHLTHNLPFAMKEPNPGYFVSELLKPLLPLQMLPGAIVLITVRSIRSCQFPR